MSRLALTTSITGLRSFACMTLAAMALTACGARPTIEPADANSDTVLVDVQTDGLLSDGSDVRDVIDTDHVDVTDVTDATDAADAADATDVVFVDVADASSDASDATTDTTDVANEWDPLESTCRHASLSIL